MSRRTLGVILLPLPFAALPVVVVLAGALFSGNSEPDIVARESTAPVIEQRVLETDQPQATTDTMARVSQPAEFEPGCNGYDLRIES